jgi:type II secretory pathway pseudopilin PulG
MNRTLYNVDKKGFTLVETIIYMAILIVLLAVIVNSVLLLTTHYRAVRNTREMEDSAIATFERMTRDIKDADGFIASSTVLQVANGSLALFKQDIASGQSTTTEYYVENDRLYVRENGIVLGPLTKQSINVTALIFRRIDTGESTAFKIEMSLQTDQAAPNVISNNFYNTVVMRGSY